MVGPRRPQFVLFGSSIVQFSFGEEGWGAILADIYARKADIVLRGYSGWNSRQAVEVLDQVFPKDEAIQPSLVIVYFGGNDSVLPTQDGLSSHVPLDEYVENMRKIAIHLKSLSEKTRIIFLTAPPVNESQILQFFGTKGRKNELCKKYADACVKLCKEMNIKCINLCTTLKQRDDWLTTCFTDGIHLTPIGSKIVAKEILKVIMEAEWKPSLDWESLPVEFA
ncbi:GDSL esterase/lipase CPRD49 [Lactuca sativa]|uniref:SGNH hydrolase-type esterase domain-containing protein n=1 Tax=Lactuca sativa TaxID=4236 RepID=A0A9R1UR07_LACSA|nr:GDSL esterase/lipase CPRD49 [Lactuca sativa]KAJ0191363.1 hypothetical protein LSAT_V11C800429400 [Lactuca sativa]